MIPDVRCAYTSMEDDVHNADPGGGGTVNRSHESGTRPPGDASDVLEYTSPPVTYVVSSLLLVSVRSLMG